MLGDTCVRACRHSTRLCRSNQVSSRLADHNSAQGGCRDDFSTVVYLSRPFSRESFCGEKMGRAGNQSEIPSALPTIAQSWLLQIGQHDLVSCGHVLSAQLGFRLAFRYAISDFAAFELYRRQEVLVPVSLEDQRIGVCSLPGFVQGGWKEDTYLGAGVSHCQDCRIDLGHLHDALAGRDDFVGCNKLEGHLSGDSGVAHQLSSRQAREHQQYRESPHFAIHNSPPKTCFVYGELIAILEQNEARVNGVTLKVYQLI